jgi:hypothetical protein
MATVAAPLAGHPLTCACETPLPWTRPSGTLVCVNDGCGGRIEAPPEKKERP